MDVDWWHVATVVVLALALGCEAIGAYCAQKERLLGWRGTLFGRAGVNRSPGDGKITGWSRLWLKTVPSRSEDLPYVDYRESILDPEFGTLARGIGRLAVAALFLVLFAFDQSLPILGKLS